MSKFVSDVRDYYDSSEEGVGFDEHAIDLNYSQLKSVGFLSPTSFRLPITLMPMLEEILKRSPYSSKAELIYEMLISQIQEFAEEFPSSNEDIEKAAQDAMDAWNAKHASPREEVQESLV